MKRLITNTLVAVFATTLAGYGVAQAQDWDEDEDLGGFDEPMEDEGLGMDEPAAAEAPAADASPTGWLTGWPQQQVLRPTTLPAGGMSVGADIFADKGFDFVLVGRGLESFDFGGLSFRYGVNEKIEVGASYALMLQPDFEAKGVFLVGGGFNVMRTDNMDLTARATLGYAIDAEMVTPLVLGADFKFLLNDKMAIVSPANHLTAFIEEPFDGFRPIFLTLPVGFGFQATDNVYVQADTTLAVIEISDYDTGFFGADFVPLRVMGFFSPNNTMDIGAGISTDIKNEPGDSLAFHVSFRYHMGVE